VSKPEPEQQGLMRILISKLELAIESFGKGGIAEYVALFDKPGRLLWLNFLAGLVRGFGMAVGFYADRSGISYLPGALGGLEPPGYR
jgi:hypothetical protein